MSRERWVAEVTAPAASDRNATVVLGLVANVSDLVTFGVAAYGVLATSDAAG